jgi:DHA1 family bicyclomycin/chloramphenicol resistance-like MFS transporter
MRDPDIPAPVQSGPRALSEWKLLALLIAITAVGPLSLTILMPAMPGIITALNSDIQTVQLALSLYLVAMAFSQLVLGAISDRFGRRPVLIGGLALTVVASLAAYFADTITLLIIARVIQAFGASTGIVIGRAIIRDSYDRERSAVMISWVTMAMVVVPMVAPSIGGILQTAFGWPAIFACIALGAGAVLAAVIVALPETLVAQTREQREAANTWTDLSALLRVPAFYGYVLCCATSSALFFAFLGGAPHAVVTIMGRSTVELGLWFALGGAGYMLGNFVTARWSTAFGLRRMISLGAWVALAGSLLMVTLTWLAPNGGPGTLFVPHLIAAFANGLMLANCIAGAISVRPQAAGTAAGITGFMQMAVGAAGAQLVTISVSDATTALPMALVLLGFAVSCVVFFLTLLARR